MTDLNHRDPCSLDGPTKQHTSESDTHTFVNEPCQPFLRDKGEAPFKDSWEAEAYALGNLLVKLNHVTPKEWMDLMGESIQEAQAFGDPDTGETYYQHWCRSLEKYCFKSGLSNPLQHQQLLKLWRAAIINTPHGVPLAIDNAVVIPSKPVHPHEHGPAHGQSIHSANLDHDEHLHCHDRPSVPPPTYYEPIAIQILGPQST